MAENPTAGLTQEEEEENIDYDSDGNPIPSTTKKIIMPLPPIDHSEVKFIILTENTQLFGGVVVVFVFLTYDNYLIVHVAAFFAIFHRLIIHPLRKTFTKSMRNSAAWLELRCWSWGINWTYE